MCNWLWVFSRIRMGQSTPVGSWPRWLKHLLSWDQRDALENYTSGQPIQIRS